MKWVTTLFAVQNWFKCLVFLKTLNCLIVYAKIKIHIHIHACMQKSILFSIWMIGKCVLPDCQVNKQSQESFDIRMKSFLWTACVYIFKEKITIFMTDLLCMKYSLEKVEAPFILKTWIFEAKTHPCIQSLIISRLCK